MATGFSADNAGNQPTLVDKWDGTQWAIVSSPSPGSPYSYLLGVSCTSPSLCVSADSHHEPPPAFQKDDKQETQRLR
jgi:hypothetical protein